MKHYITMMFLLASGQTLAAIEPPSEHIHFLAEHLAEAAQDARYYAMPWPTGDYSSTDWQPLASVGGARVSNDFASVSGSLLTLGISKNWNPRWSTELLVYYDRFNVRGGQTENVLLPFSLNAAPLDLPERAVFSRPSGEILHTGAALIVSHGLDIQDSAWTWDAIGGVLVENLKLKNYTFEYELTGGADAGTTGVLDHSGNSHFIYYVVGIQAKKPFGDHYIMIPRFIYGRPNQNGDLTTRLTGPGFDISTASTSAKPNRIGDEFGYFGMTVRDIQNHIEMDVGAILGYAAFEYIAHEGVKSALLLSVTWRM